MSERKTKSLSRRDFLGVSVGAVAAGIGCGESDPQTSGTGGQTGTGGANTGSGPGAGGTGTGGSPAVGSGGTSAGGAAGGATGGAASGTGGVSAAGASDSGGTSAGGTSTGGTSATGGTAEAGQGGATATGGTSTGGTSTGGTSTGGTSAGGTSTGGTSATGATGGTAEAGQGGATATGGTAEAGQGGATATGGTSTGGAGTGGTGGATDGLVTMVSGTDWKQTTKDAVLARLPDLTGKTVVIRPNVIEGRPDGTTNPDVIAGVVAAVKQKGASQIIVAEDAFNGNAVTFMDTLGITTAVGSDATCTNLAGTATTNYKPANAAAWNDANGLDFYDAVYNADYVINVPRCKTHSIAGFSMALKAWFGSVKRPSSGILHASIHDKAAEAHLVKQENLVVLDATRCMTSGGPMQGGNMAESKIVVVTEDAIAADVTGVAIIRHFGGSLAVPWTLNQIRRAMALNFPGWLTTQTDFTYSATGIDEVDAIMAKRSA